MTIAYPGPAAGHVWSPHRSDALPAGSGSPSTDPFATWRVDLKAIASELAAAAGELAELRGLTERSWILLAATDLFEAWAIGWPPGGGIDLHDHGPSNGVVAVAAGTLTETNVRVARRGTVVIGTQRIHAGEQREFGAGYVHDLTNDGEDEAVSVHVYGPRLYRMRYYELDGRGRLVIASSEHLAPDGPAAETHDPS